MEKVELLAPARNFKAIRAASQFADSVYFGIEKFNMRMRAENIVLDDLHKVVGFCQKNDLKTYLATNILIYDNDIEYLRSIIERSKEAGIDAVIVHDLAAIQIAKENKIVTGMNVNLGLLSFQTEF